MWITIYVTVLVMMFTKSNYRSSAPNNVFWLGSYKTKPAKTNLLTLKHSCNEIITREIRLFNVNPPMTSFLHGRWGWQCFGVESTSEEKYFWPHTPICLFVITISINHRWRVKNRKHKNQAHLRLTQYFWPATIILSELYQLHCQQDKRLEWSKIFIFSCRYKVCFTDID